MTQEKLIALIRVAFGFVWAIDAWFKWQPAFLNGFIDQVAMMLSGQPAWITSWIGWWVQVVSINPHLFALIVALGETAIAIGLIFGLFTRIAIVGGILLALVIWSVPEAFGGPYVAGSTDIGTGIIYIFVFLALWAGGCWKAHSLDSVLKGVRKVPHHTSPSEG
jgi:thiosulfate dehydrogenase (quinone) large subunit